MKHTIEIESDINIKHPAFQAIYMKAMGCIMKAVTVSIAKEVGDVIEGLEYALEKANKQTKGKTEVAK